MTNQEKIEKLLQLDWYPGAIKHGLAFYVRTKNRPYSARYKEQCLLHIMLELENWRHQYRKWSYLDKVAPPSKNEKEFYELVRSW